MSGLYAYTNCFCLVTKCFDIRIVLPVLSIMYSGNVNCYGQTPELGLHHSIPSSALIIHLCCGYYRARPRPAERVSFL